MRSFTVFCGLLLATVTGCPKTGQRADAPRPDPDEAAAIAMAKYDTNGDGSLSGQEINASPGLGVASRRMDADGDGLITPDEIIAHFEVYHEVDLTLISLTAQVTLDGQLLPGATVTLVPDPINGEATRPATGVTDDLGRCVLATEGARYPAVGLGLYRVSVSRLDESGAETLPAKYNSDSDLGLEVSNEASKAGELDFGVKVDMVSR